MQIGVHKVAMAAPNDVSELAKLIEAGAVNPAEIVALIGKTEGNGGANDFTRGFATLSYQNLLSRHLGITPDEVGKKVAFVWSGGTEGVLSPHATVFTRSAATGKADLLFIQDEGAATNPFARVRLSYACRAEPVAHQTAEWIRVMDRFEQEFGGVGQALDRQRGFAGQQ